MFFIYVPLCVPIFYNPLIASSNMDSCALRNYFNGRNDINNGNLIAVMKALGYELQVFNK